MQVTYLETCHEVAKGLKCCLDHMGPWKIEHLTMGIRSVGKSHGRHDVKDFLPGTDVVEKAVLHDLKRELKCDSAAAGFTVACCAGVRGVVGSFDVFHTVPNCYGRLCI